MLDQTGYFEMYNTPVVLTTGTCTYTFYLHYNLHIPLSVTYNTTGTLNEQRFETLLLSRRICGKAIPDYSRARSTFVTLFVCYSHRECYYNKYINQEMRLIQYNL